MVPGGGSDFINFFRHLFKGGTANLFLFYYAFSYVRPERFDGSKHTDTELVSQLKF